MSRFILYFILCFCANQAFAQNKKSPSLQETMDWIKDKIDLYTKYEIRFKDIINRDNNSVETTERKSNGIFSLYSFDVDKCEVIFIEKESTEYLWTGKKTSKDEDGNNYDGISYNLYRKEYLFKYVFKIQDISSDIGYEKWNPDLKKLSSYYGFLFEDLEFSTDINLFSINLFSKDNKKSIVKKTHVDYYSKTKSYSEKDPEVRKRSEDLEDKTKSYFVILFSDEDIAKRTVTAFNNAITQCKKSKKEIF